MLLTRKPIADEVWQNVRGGEPMPEWVTSLAEPGSKPGHTFRINSEEYGWRLVPTGYYIIKGPTDTYPCSPAGLAASYDLPEVPSHVPGSPDVPDVQLGQVVPPEADKG